MGCAFSRRFDGDERNIPAKSNSSTRDRGVVPEADRVPVIPRRSCYGGFDSAEFTPVKAGAGKLSETGAILGRAGIAGLERAVEVLDTLGSSMTSLNSGSGFIAGITNRGKKVSILAFEVANTIAKASSLWRSCSEESIRQLKEDILQSEGVRILVSSDYSELLHFAAVDKREELAVFSKEVVRFGNLCKDPIWHNLGRYFDKLESDLTPQDQSEEEIETIAQQLIDLAQNTSELYHELHALDRFEQDFHRKFHEEGSQPAARRESVMILHSELKRQRKLVKNLKKKSLWSRNLEEVVEKLVEMIIFLHKHIRDTFSDASPGLSGFEEIKNKRLGPSGLALHYANIINQIENIVSRPLSLPPSTRDNLYHGLPTAVKSALRSRLRSFHNKECTVAQIKDEMQKTLDWIVPIAENTIRAHQGFGWVGEWANLGIEINNRSAPQSSTTRIETLHHADKEKTEQYLLELVVLLHHLVLQVKNRGYGFKSTKQDSSRSQKGTSSSSQKETSNNSNNNSSPSCNGKADDPVISEDERELLDHISAQKITYGRSKSWKPAIGRKKKTQRNRRLCISYGNSPSREFGVTLGFLLDKRRALDVIDGLETLNPYSPPFG